MEGTVRCLSCPGEEHHERHQFSCASIPGVHCPSPDSQVQSIVWVEGGKVGEDVSAHAEMGQSKKEWATQGQGTAVAGHTLVFLWSALLLALC